MFLASWQDEALARDGVSREVPCSALKGETVPDSEGSCGGGGAPRDSAGSGATEEGLTSRGGRHLRLPLRLDPDAGED